VSALAACQLLLPDAGGGGGSDATSSATGVGSCDESKALAVDTNECAGDKQCSGFCQKFQAACGNGFSDFRAGCCKACAGLETLPGTPFCCRSDLFAKQANCGILPFGNGSPECGPELASFCVMFKQACGVLTDSLVCDKGQAGIVGACSTELYKALADPTKCGDVRSCVVDNFTTGG
jgi:hypothetical protein